MKTLINGRWVEGTPQEIADLLKLKEKEENQNKTKRCACYVEDPSGYTTTYHKVGTGCSECRNKHY